MVNDLFEGRIVQVVEYYSLYITDKKYTEETAILFQKFEDEHLVPRLTKKDQIFTEHVLALIKAHRTLGEKIYRSIEVQ